MSKNKIKLVLVNQDHEVMGKVLTYSVPREGDRIIIEGKHYRVLGCYYNIVPFKEMEEEFGPMAKVADIFGAALANDEYDDERKLLAVKDVTLMVELM